MVERESETEVGWGGRRENSKEMVCVSMCVHGERIGVGEVGWKDMYKEWCKVRSLHQHDGNASSVYGE